MPFTSMRFCIVKTRPVISLDRTTDYGLVRSILTAPGIYELIGDDFSPPREKFAVNTHPLIRYVTAEDDARGLFGLFCLFPQNYICWELHVVMLPGATAPEKWGAARGLLPWLAGNTGCRRLTAMVPQHNAAARIYVSHGVGMRYVGRHQQAFPYRGQLEDLLIFGAPVPEEEE
jgi:hypothetical protein